MDIVDATCPYVRRAQNLARELSGENIQVVVVGDKEHPEVQVIIDWTYVKAMVVENPEEAAELTAAGPIGVVAQTTQPQENFDAVVEVLRKTGAEVRVCNICKATAERQKAALICPAGRCYDCGSTNSANTRKSASLCRASEHGPTMSRKQAR